MSAGILCKDQVKQLIEPAQGTCRLFKLSGDPFEKSFIDLSAINLPLCGNYWEMQASCRTGSEYKVADLTQKYALGRAKDLGEGPVVLKKRHVYLFNADCELDLKDTMIQGKATGKSSVGRLDVLVRLLVDGSDRFDFVGPNKQHRLYVEVTPISFDLEVKRGTTLSQLRLFKGKENDISLTREELSCEEDDAFPVLDENGKPNRNLCRDELENIWFPFCLDLAPDPKLGFSAFVSKKGDALPPINPNKEKAYDPHDYWESIKAKNNSILLEPDRLYILRSKNRLRMPAHLALECKSYTTEMGEWRIEYAGFAHPHFGSYRDDKRGTPIIFEVRGHNVPTILTDQIPLGNVRFLRMSRAARRPQKKPSYEEQELTLSRCFKPWSQI